MTQPKAIDVLKLLLQSLQLMMLLQSLQLLVMLLLLQLGHFMGSILPESRAGA